MTTRKYGRKRDAHDTRDRLFTVPRSIHTLPPAVDLTAFCGPIKDQGDEGSCTGHAYSSIREWIARKYQGKEPVLSPQFLYVQELLEEGSFPEDDGAQARTGCVILNKYGCAEESVEPYVAGELHRPTELQLSSALEWKAGAYHRIATLVDVLTCLSNITPWPVSLGFNVYESFESEEVAKTGVMPIPKPDEQLLGGHEVFAVGYDRAREALLCQNSWGTSWGITGRFWMPFKVAADVSTDKWMIHLGHWS